MEISRSHSQSGPDEDGATSRSSSAALRKFAASPMSMSRSQQLSQRKSSFGDSDDLEAGSEDQPQCRICLESDGMEGSPPFRHLAWCCFEANLSRLLAQHVLFCVHH